MATASQATLIPITNAGFELGSDGSGGVAEFGTPDSWEEDFPRSTNQNPHPAQFANSGTSAAVDPGPLGSIMARIAVNGDSDPLTTFEGSISPEGTLGTYAADTVYTLTFHAAWESGWIPSGSWFAWGGFRDGADGTANVVSEVDVDIKDLGDSGTFGEASVTLSTVDQPSLVGQDMDIFVGFRHRDNYNKTMYFDDVSLDAAVLSEPSTVALFAGLSALGLILYRRRRA